MELALVCLAVGCVLLVCGFLALVYLGSRHVAGEVERSQAFARDALETLKATTLKEKVEAQTTRELDRLRVQQLVDAFNLEVEKVKGSAKDPTPLNEGRVATTVDGRRIPFSRLEEVGPHEIE